MVIEEREEQAIRLTKEVEAQLAEPFKEGEEKRRKGRGGVEFTYVDARAVMDRLDAVVGSENWSTKYVPLYIGPPGQVIDSNGEITTANQQPKPIAFECQLTVCGVTKADAGQALDEDEPFKSVYSDSFKRAAVTFGVGRYLYQDSSSQRGGNSGGGGQTYRPSGNGGGGGGGAKPQTQSQFNFIEKLAEGLGLTTMDLDNEAAAKFNVAGVRALNSFQSSKYIDDLKNRGGGNGGGGNRRRNDDDDFGQGYDDF